MKIILYLLKVVFRIKSFKNATDKPRKREGTATKPVKADEFERRLSDYNEYKKSTHL